MSRRTSRSRDVSWSSSGSTEVGAAAAGMPAKASRTNPARRGENTASPPATRCTASIRSTPEMALVTYPRAPARMTAMTSSGASDTDSARKRTPGRDTFTASITAWPPPSGMCTSRSTTSGSRSAISSTAAATSSASPTTSTVSPSSARTPARNRWWSSTRNTRGRVGVGESVLTGPAASGGSAPTSVPSPGAVRRSARPPWRRIRAWIDSAIPRRSSATCVGVETPPPVADEDRHLGRLDLGEQRDGRSPRPLGGVHRRLPGGRQQRPQPVVERAVADRHHVDRDPVVGLDLGGDAAASPPRTW